MWPDWGGIWMMCQAAHGARRSARPHAIWRLVAPAHRADLLGAHLAVSEYLARAPAENDLFLLLIVQGDYRVQAVELLTQFRAIGVAHVCGIQRG